MCPHFNFAFKFVCVCDCVLVYCCHLFMARETGFYFWQWYSISFLDVFSFKDVKKSTVGEERSIVNQLNVALPYDPAFCGAYTQKNWKQVLNNNKKNCTQMFIASLFPIVKSWRQHKWPSKDDWVSKVCLPTMQYYSDIKGNKASIHATKWMNWSHVATDNLYFWYHCLEAEVGTLGEQKRPYMQLNQRFWQL